MANKAVILVVDDDRVLRETFSYSLENAGYKVIKASSGQEAIGIVKKQHPDLILLDVQMPLMNGFETAEVLQRDEETSEIPILFLTGEARDSASVEKGFKIGADDYLTKGQSTKEILLRIERTLNRRNRRSVS